MALPGVALAVIGLFHPMDLTPETAARWWQLHVLLLPVFPLLGVPLLVLLRDEGGPVVWIGRIAVYVYAVFYTGLDTLAGIAAGVAVETEPGGSPTALRLIALGNQLAEVGVWAFLFAAFFTFLLVGAGARWRAFPGSLLLGVGAGTFLDAHIYWPKGTIAVLAIALGCALLAAAKRPALAGSST
jgi:hypothetical protein